MTGVDARQLLGIELVYVIGLVVHHLHRSHLVIQRWQQHGKIARLGISRDDYPPSIVFLGTTRAVAFTRGCHTGRISQCRVVSHRSETIAYQAFRILVGVQHITRVGNLQCNAGLSDGVLALVLIYVGKA